MRILNNIRASLLNEAIAKIFFMPHMHAAGMYMRIGLIDTNTTDICAATLNKLNKATRRKIRKKGLPR